MNQIQSILPANLLYLLLLLSCGSQPVAPITGEALDLALTQDSIVPSKDTSSVWFPLDTVPFLIAEQFSQLAILEKTIVRQDKVIRQKNLLIRKSVLEIDGHIVSYTALFKKAGNEAPYGELRDDNYLSAIIKFDEKEFDFEQINVIGVHPFANKPWDSPITFAPEDYYLTDSLYAKVQLGDKKYFILNTGPASCGVCDGGLYMIFELNAKSTDINLYALYHEDNKGKRAVGDCNNDKILDLYIHYAKERRGNFSLMVPVTIDTSNNHLVKGVPIYYLDRMKEEAKIYTGNPYDIIGR